MKVLSMFKIMLAASAGVILAIIIGIMVIGFTISAPAWAALTIIILLLIAVSHVQAIKILSKVASKNTGRRLLLIKTLLTDEEKRLLSRTVDDALQLNNEKHNIDVQEISKYEKLKKILSSTAWK